MAEAHTKVYAEEDRMIPKILIRAMLALVLATLAIAPGQTVLDAGCGTGAFAVEAARRGAEVVAIDVAGSLVEIARERTPEELRANISYLVGDMLSDDLGEFDRVVAMDSLIHYAPEQMVAVLARLAADTSGSIVFTFAPATTALLGSYCTPK